MVNHFVGGCSFSGFNITYLAAERKRFSQFILFTNTKIGVSEESCLYSFQVKKVYLSAAAYFPFYWVFFVKFYHFGNVSILSLLKPIRTFVPFSLRRKYFQKRSTKRSISSSTKSRERNTCNQMISNDCNSSCHSIQYPLYTLLVSQGLPQNGGYLFSVSVTLRCVQSRTCPYNKRPNFG